MTGSDYVLRNWWLFIWDHLRQVLLNRSPDYGRPPNHYLGHIVKGKVPIILIQGYGMRWQNMASVGEHISWQGYPVHVINGLADNRMEIGQSARIVREHVESEKIKNAIIVAHSKGCLIGKYFLVHLNKDKRVKGMVAIAGPFSGTKIAHLVSWKNVAELRTDSQIIQDLNGHKEVNKQIISIFPCRDDMVWAEKGSYLEGALDNVELPDWGHTGLFFSKRGKEAVLQAVERLSNRDF